MWGKKLTRFFLLQNNLSIVHHGSEMYGASRLVRGVAGRKEMVGLGASRGNGGPRAEWWAGLCSTTFPSSLNFPQPQNEVIVLLCNYNQHSVSTQQVIDR